MMGNICYYIWNIPDGLATFIAGCLALGAAGIAWRSVQQQIRAAKQAEDDKLIFESTILKKALYADLMNYVTPVIAALSEYNQNSSTSTKVLFTDPLVYKNMISRLGCLEKEWVIGSIITFYAIVLQLNEMAHLPPDTHFEVRSEDVGERLRRMACNLAEALDGIEPDRILHIQPELNISTFFIPGGKTADLLKPASLQDLLRKLALPQ